MNLFLVEAMLWPITRAHEDHAEKTNWKVISGLFLLGFCYFSG